MEGMTPIMLPCWFTKCSCVDGDGREYGGDGGDCDGVVDVCV